MGRRLRAYSTLGYFPLTSLRRVYAKRIGSTSLKYNYRKKRFEWVRFAEATAPQMEFADKRKRRIPWPEDKLPPYRAQRTYILW